MCEHYSILGFALSDLKALAPPLPFGGRPTTYSYRRTCITSQFENDRFQQTTDSMLGRAVDDASTGSDSDYSK